MTDKELHKLNRRELLQLMLAQGREAEKAKQDLAETEEKLSQLEEGYERLKRRLDDKDAQIHKLRAALQTVQDGGAVGDLLAADDYYAPPVQREQNSYGNPPAQRFDPPRESQERPAMRMEQPVQRSAAPQQELVRPVERMQEPAQEHTQYAERPRTGQDYSQYGSEYARSGPEQRRPPPPQQEQRRGYPRKQSYREDLPPGGRTVRRDQEYFDYLFGPDPDAASPRAGPAQTQSEPPLRQSSPMRPEVRQNTPMRAEPPQNRPMGNGMADAAMQPVQPGFQERPGPEAIGRQEPGRTMPVPPARRGQEAYEAPPRLSRNERPASETRYEPRGYDPPQARPSRREQEYYNQLFRQEMGRDPSPQGYEPARYQAPAPRGGAPGPGDAGWAQVPLERGGYAPTGPPGTEREYGVREERREEAPGGYAQGPAPREEPIRSYPPPIPEPSPEPYYPPPQQDEFTPTADPPRAGGERIERLNAVEIVNGKAVSQSQVLRPKR